MVKYILLISFCLLLILSFQTKELESQIMLQQVFVHDNNANVTVICSVPSIDTSYSGTKGTFIDDRDGKIYGWVKIGNQIWMESNLSFKAEKGCYAFKNKWRKANIKGYLYSWSTAQKVAPKGWHLPKKEEYYTMLNIIGGDNPRVIYDSLKLDKYGLNLEINGEYWSKKDTYVKGWLPFHSTSLWTATYGITSKNDTLYSYFVCDKFSKRVGIKFDDSKENGRPVRCIRDL